MTGREKGCRPGGEWGSLTKLGTEWEPGDFLDQAVGRRGKGIKILGEPLVPVCAVLLGFDSPQKP